eukprot:168161-Pyramimonas_sp.AAC.1
MEEMTLRRMTGGYDLSSTRTQLLADELAIFRQAFPFDREVDFGGEFGLRSLPVALFLCRDE